VDEKHRTNLAAAIHQAKLIKSGLDPFRNDMPKYDSSQTDLLLGQEENDDAKSDSKQFLGLQQNFKHSIVQVSSASDFSEPPVKKMTKTKDKSPLDDERYIGTCYNRMLVYNETK